MVTSTSSIQNSAASTTYDNASAFSNALTGTSSNIPGSNGVTQITQSQTSSLYLNLAPGCYADIVPGSGSTTSPYIIYQAQMPTMSMPDASNTTLYPQGVNDPAYKQACQVFYDLTGVTAQVPPSPTNPLYASGTKDPQYIQDLSAYKATLAKSYSVTRPDITNINRYANPNTNNQYNGNVNTLFDVADNAQYIADMGAYNKALADADSKTLEDVKTLQKQAQPIPSQPQYNGQTFPVEVNFESQFPVTYMPDVTNSILYPKGVKDINYQNDCKVFTDLTGQKVATPPDATNTTLYPQGKSDRAYISALSSYEQQIQTGTPVTNTSEFNNSATSPSDPAWTEYNLDLQASAKAVSQANSANSSFQASLTGFADNSECSTVNIIAGSDQVAVTDNTNSDGFITIGSSTADNASVYTFNYNNLGNQMSVSNTQYVYYDTSGTSVKEEENSQVIGGTLVMPGGQTAQSNDLYNLADAFTLMQADNFTTSLTNIQVTAGQSSAAQDDALGNGLNQAATIITQQVGNSARVIQDIQQAVEDNVSWEQIGKALNITIDASQYDTSDPTALQDAYFNAVTNLFESTAQTVKTWLANNANNIQVSIANYQATKSAEEALSSFNEITAVLSLILGTVSCFANCAGAFLAFKAFQANQKSVTDNTSLLESVQQNIDKYPNDPTLNAALDQAQTNLTSAQTKLADSQLNLGAWSGYLTNTFGTFGNDGYKLDTPNVATLNALINRINSAGVPLGVDTTGLNSNETQDVSNLEQTLNLQSTPEWAEFGAALRQGILEFSQVHKLGTNISSPDTYLLHAPQLTSVEANDPNAVYYYGQPTPGSTARNSLYVLYKVDAPILQYFSPS